MEEKTALPKWEYCEAFLHDRGYEILSELGESGWELVSVVSGENGNAPTAYLKRPAGFFTENANEELTKRQRNEVLKIMSDALIGALR